MWGGFEGWVVAGGEDGAGGGEGASGEHGGVSVAINSTSVAESLTSDTSAPYNRLQCLSLLASRLP